MPRNRAAISAQIIAAGVDRVEAWLDAGEAAQDPA
jgi:hypothetical protein